MPSRYRIVLLTVVVCAVALLAYAELQRVAAGRLFLLAMPFDAPASRVELFDAKSSAEQNLPWAIASVLAIGLLMVYFTQASGPSLSWSKLCGSRLAMLLVGIFLFAVAADLASTLWFFHARGIDHEVHPAIRLFGYAYGRTMGPVLGKLLQATGLLLLTLALPHSGKWILLAATGLYLAAAAYNVWLM